MMHVQVGLRGDTASITQYGKIGELTALNQLPGCQSAGNGVLFLSLGLVVRWPVAIADSATMMVDDFV